MNQISKISACAIILVGVCVGTHTMAQAVTLAQPLPQAWQYTPDLVQQTPDEDSWWRTFADPVLDSLIVEGVRRNYDVAAAYHRMEAARAQMRGARAGYYPTVDISAGWTKTRPEDYFGLGASASWEIDIFGKVTAGVKQKKASWRASRAEYVGTMVSVASEIATTYIALRVAQAELLVAREHIESQGKIVAIAEARHETGLASALDVAQAKAVYYATISSVPQLQNTIHTSLNSIATLLGVYATDLPAAVVEPAALPAGTVVVATGVPADLLRRRPDLLEAEQNLAAAAAAVGIAKKDFLPTLSIDAQITTQAHDIDKLFTNKSYGWSVAPTLSWTLFSGFARREAVAEAKAQMEAAIDQYNLAVMTAVAETDNAMDNCERSRQAVKALEDVVAESAKALKLSTDLYKSGNSGFINVADGQLSLLSYTNQLITARGNVLTSLISLYRALGGGWATDL